MPEAAKTIRPKPLTRKPGPVPQTQPFSAPLEEQWYTAAEPVTAVAPVPTERQQPDPATRLTLGKLEVVSMCQLSPDKRLLVVKNEGCFALMGQCGPEKENINVLKMFAHNPLAYQHTFTAVEEGQSAGQGMYVIQLGTWHAIISTFQDKITLHTELG
jgi:hypothetical protein